jgi:hypothetical protein
MRRTAIYDRKRYRLVHHGLVEISGGGSRPGIYWLRLYRSRCGVAVVTEMPGNPGISMANNADRIWEFLVENFQLDPQTTTMYQIWPQGAPGEPCVFRIPHGGPGGARWRVVRRKKLERHIRNRLEPLPPHDELYRRICAMGGGNEDEKWLDVFEALPVDRLPPPHHPGKCEHAGRFTELAAQLGESAAGAVFLTTLFDDDRARCRYHSANWHTIADASVRVLQDCGVHADLDDYMTAVYRAGLTGQDQAYLASLFSDPIDIAAGGYSNGQHRACALRFSGARAAAIITSRKSVGMHNIDWHYDGDG